MKALWRGDLLFGKVKISIKLYTAIQKHTLGFNILHAKCNTPVDYLRYCPKCKKKIEWGEVVKGMKLADGSYFVMTPESIKQLRPEKTDTIVISEFVGEHAISPIYYNEHYYIAPVKATDKAYYLLLEVLRELEKIAVGSFVLRDREHVFVVQPYDDVLLLSTLHYAYEIQDARKVEELSVSVFPKITPKELSLAEQIVKKHSRKFNISDFKDTFAQELRERLKKKTRGKALAREVSKIPTRAKEKEESLLASLQASVQSRQSSKTKSRSVAYAQSSKKPKKVTVKRATKKTKRKK